MAEAAIQRVGELQEALALTTDRVALAVGITADSVGQTHMQSGQNALSFLAGVQERISEAYGMSQQAVAELQRYRNGF